jgi:hypothetical protein
MNIKKKKEPYSHKSLFPAHEVKSDPTEEEDFPHRVASYLNSHVLSCVRNLTFLFKAVL